MNIESQFSLCRPNCKVTPTLVDQTMNKHQKEHSESHLSSTNEVQNLEASSRESSLLVRFLTYLFIQNEEMISLEDLNINTSKFKHA